MTGIGISASIPGAAAAGAVAGAAAGVVAGGVTGAGVNGAIGAAIGVASAVGALIPATIRCTEVGSSMGLVPFDFNPTKIVITRSASSTSHPASGTGTGSPTGSGGAIIWKSDPPSISIADIIFEGLTTKLRCDTLLNWQSPPAISPKAIQNQATGNPVDSQPPTLTFQWGPPLVGFMYDVKLTSTTISYERFNPTGIPVRAKVSLKMVQQVSMFSNLPTNPTSGGLPGRHTHVVKSGDSLQSIATAFYGRPQAWRQIADINGINDPARLRPGTTVYLPNAGELNGGVAS